MPAAKAYFVPHNGARAASNLNDGDNKTFETISLSNLKSIGLEFDKPHKVNCVVLKEYLVNGQYCQKFTLLLMDKKHELLRRIEGTTIGRKRIIIFPSTVAGIVELTAEGKNGATEISEIEAYSIINMDQHLTINKLNN
ncbi:MAG: hypothetical protein ABJA71_16645 [Ginsengibacter sp.]